MASVAGPLSFWLPATSPSICSQRREREREREERDKRHWREGEAANSKFGERESSVDVCAARSAEKRRD